MKNKKLFYFISSLFFIGILLNTIGKDYTYAKSKIDVSKKYSPQNESFDINSERLPLKFKGNDIAKVYKQLEKSIPKRSEYETAEKYFGRIEELIPVDLYVFKIEKVAVPYSISDDNNISVEYNANEENFQIFIKAEKLNNITLSIYYEDLYKRNSKEVDLISKYPDIVTKGTYGAYSIIAERELGIPIKSSGKNTGNYTGTNAFGATRKVTESQKVTYYISLTNSDQIKEEDKDHDKALHYVLNIPPDEAKKVKPNIGILAICKITATLNPSFYTTVYEVPKINYPYSIKNIKYYLSVNLKAIWIYNMLTGEIYSKNDIVNELLGTVLLN